MQFEIKHIHESIGVTAVYVTHDQSEALTMADRIAVFNDGRIQQLAPPSTLYEKPENSFVAQFIGSPSMNLLPGKIRTAGSETAIDLDGGGAAITAIPTSADNEGRTVNIGVRPEDLIETTGDYLYHGKVNITEALGEVTILYFAPEADGIDPVIGKLPGIHGDLRGNLVKLNAPADKIQIFHEGKSLLYR